MPIGMAFVNPGTFVIVAKKVSESIVISSYEKNKKQGKKHMINYSNDLI